jgi:hypothetical protein
MSEKVGDRFLFAALVNLGNFKVIAAPNFARNPKTSPGPGLEVL